MATDSRLLPFRVRCPLSYIAAVVGCVFSVWLYAPGGMIPDSLYSFSNAMTGKYGDEHAPILALVWRTLLSFDKGPLPMLVLQNMLFWTGLAVTVEKGLPRLSMKCVWVLSIGLWPPLFGQLGIVWKDTQGLASLFAAFGLILSAPKSVIRFVHLSAALLLLFYVSALRPIGCIIVLPLVYVGVGRFCAISKKQHFMATILVTISLGLNGNLLNAWLARHHRAYPAQRLLVFDIVGMSALSGRNLLPAFWSDYTLSQLRTMYTPWGNPLIFWVENWPFTMPKPSLAEANNSLSGTARKTRLIRHLVEVRDRDRFAGISRAWAFAVLQNPINYVAHRLAVSRCLFGLHMQAVCFPYSDTIIHNEAWKIGQRPPPVESLRYRLNRGVTLLLYEIRNSLLFRGYVYLVLLCALWVYLARRHGASNPISCFLACGILNAGVLVLAAPSCDFRYLIPTVGAFLVGTAALRECSLTRNN